MDTSDNYQTDSRNNIDNVEGKNNSRSDVDNFTSDVDTSTDPLITAFYKVQKEGKLIRKQDKATKKSLVDGQKIAFIRDRAICHFKILRYLSDGTFGESQDDEDYSMIDYQEFLDNNMTIDNLGLINKDEVVLKMSYIDILFNSPNFGSDTTFRIMADNELVGFAREELGLKIMQRFHLLYFLFQNYNMERGNIRETPIIHFDTKRQNGTCFEPIIGYQDYSDNGLSHIVYNEDKKIWKFIPRCVG